MSTNFSDDKIDFKISEKGLNFTLRNFIEKNVSIVPKHSTWYVVDDNNNQVDTILLKDFFIVKNKILQE
ncbi:MAG: hypothetical protein ACTSYD_13525 [Candidatus Heimdallarchaeaceae archaeon]